MMPVLPNPPVRLARNARAKWHPDHASAVHRIDTEFLRLDDEVDLFVKIAFLPDAAPPIRC
jgi:hypothetical protein